MKTKVKNCRLLKLMNKKTTNSLSLALNKCYAIKFHQEIGMK